MKTETIDIRPLLAEVVGTALLTMAALLGGTPAAPALVLAVMVYAIGSVSGCHLNPAVTVGLISLRKISIAKGISYIFAQVAGALAAAFLAMQMGNVPTSFAAPNAWGEVIGFGFLFLAVAAVVAKRVPETASGLVIGGGLLAGLLTSGGILNPAVAVAMLQTPTSPAIWGPVLGALIFALLAVALWNELKPTK